MSNLRCWPGCTAVIETQIDTRFNGKVVKCISSYLDGWGDPTWKVTPPLPQPWRGVLDEALVPITPRKESVTDSEVTELFSPAPKQRETTHG